MSCNCQGTIHDKGCREFPRPLGYHPTRVVLDDTPQREGERPVAKCTHLADCPGCRALQDAHLDKLFHARTDRPAAGEGVDQDWPSHPPHSCGFSDHYVRCSPKPPPVEGVGLNRRDRDGVKSWHCRDCGINVVSKADYNRKLADAEGRVRELQKEARADTEALDDLKDARDQAEARLEQSDSRYRELVKGVREKLTNVCPCCEAVRTLLDRERGDG